MGGETFDSKQAKKFYDLMRHASDVRALKCELQQRPQYVEWINRQNREAMTRGRDEYGL